MSSFEYNPDHANPILEAGEYDAVILDAEVSKTKKGASKMLVTLKVYDPDGLQPLVSDHITAVPFGLKRLNQLCKVTGVDFGTGIVNPKDFIAKNVHVRLKVNHDATGQYDDQNAVTAYSADQPEPEHAAGTKPKAKAKTNLIGEVAAYAHYVSKIKEQRPDVTDELLMTNWMNACDRLVSGKSKLEFEEADWIKMRAEGPAEFIPF